MEHPDLRARALRAYEIGRAADALVPALVACVLVGLSLLFPGSMAPRIGFGSALVALSFWLPYAGGPAGRAVAPGLFAALFPFAVPLLSHQASCGTGWCGSTCMAACVGGGALAGLLIGRFAARSDGGAHQVAAGGTIALLGGSLGCACIGWGGIAGMALAMVVVALPTRQLAAA